MSAPRIASAKVCEKGVCEQAHLLVRGDHIEFVSAEQAKKVGRHPLDPVAMPSDVVLPENFVLVQDTTGDVLDRCHFYIVRWHTKGTRNAHRANLRELKEARSYFGPNAKIQLGSVEIPKKPWKPVAKIEFIRYRRYGYDTPFEHAYESPVMLYDSSRPLAWRVVLPTGCVVDSRGFVWP